MNGEGLLTYSEGKFYRGSFVNDKKDGIGT